MNTNASSSTVSKQLNGLTNDKVKAIACFYIHPFLCRKPLCKKSTKKFLPIYSWGVYIGSYKNYVIMTKIIFYLFRLSVIFTQFLHVSNLNERLVKQYGDFLLFVVLHMFCKHWNVPNTSKVDASEIRPILRINKWIVVYHLFSCSFCVHSYCVTCNVYWRSDWVRYLKNIIGTNNVFLLELNRES